MTEQASYIPLLRLLERPYAVVSTDLPAALLDLNLAPSLAADVSLLQMLEGVLETGSDYWSGLALEWLESGFPMDASLCEAVLRYSQLKRNSQALRHRAFTVARRWQREVGLDA